MSMKDYNYNCIDTKLPEEPKDKANDAYEEWAGDNIRYCANGKCGDWIEPFNPTPTDTQTEGEDENN
jgi:hypothetical protein